MKVLLPVASEKLNPKVLEWVVNIGDKFNAEIDVLNVQYSFEAFTLSYPTYPEFVYVSEQNDPNHDEKALRTAEKIAESVCELIRSKSKCKVNAIGKLGEPANTVIEISDGSDYDMVVLKDRDRSEVGRFFLGSITDKIVHHCKTPVLIIKGD